MSCLPYPAPKQRYMQKELTHHSFQKEVIGNRNVAVVQFKTEWSGACQIIAPILHELAKLYKGQAFFYTVDVEKEQQLEHEYGIMELPTILFFKNGVLVDHIVGLNPRNILIQKIETVLESIQN